MSNGGSAALGLVIGAGGGLLLSYLLRDQGLSWLGWPKGGHEAGEPVPASARPSPSKVPARTSACSLRLDGAGLVADGQRVDVPGAVTRCQAAGHAELAFARTAPVAVYVELSKALSRAGVPFTVRRL